MTNLPVGPFLINRLGGGFGLVVTGPYNVKCDRLGGAYLSQILQNISTIADVWKLRNHQKLPLTVEVRAKACH